MIIPISLILLLLGGVSLLLFKIRSLRRESRETIQEQSAWMRAISSYTQSAIMVIDRSEQIRFFNQKFAELFDMTDMELENRTVSETDLPSELIESVRSNSEYAIFTDLRERSLHRQLFLQPIHAESGENIGSLLQINLEVHERNTQPFDPIAIKLEKVSHKLKTPLNSIMGYCDVLMRDESMKSEQIDYLETISENSGRILDQIDLLLNDRHEAAASELQLVSNGSPIKKILIVDDVKTNRTLLRIMLERHGYELIEAQNGKEALEKTISESPDLILMDIMMPVMDGMEAIEEIRKSKDGVSNVPVIAVTAINRRGNRERILNAGFNGYLQKPFKEKDLMALIGS